MVTLFDKHGWVEELVLVLAEEVLKLAPWGMWWRILSGSAMSIVDLGTDINVIVVYLGETGRETYGWTILGMVLLSMFMKTAAVIMNNSKAPARLLLREILIVITGLKPGVDAYRLLMNQERKVDELWTPAEQITINRTFEMFCESIPGAIIQCYALLRGSGGVTKTKITSLVISLLTTGLTSASISYEYVRARKRTESAKKVLLALRSGIPADPLSRQVRRRPYW
jgi:hypothetical protein